MTTRVVASVPISGTRLSFWIPKSFRNGFQRLETLFYARHGVRSASSSVSTENDSGGLFRLFNEQERKHLHQQRDIIDRARRLTQEIGLGELTRASQLSALQDAASFSVVLAGEFNAGKTTVINAILGENLLETGSLPTTDTITVLTSELLPATPGLIQYTHSLPLLQDLAIIDTPGTNAVVQNHTAKTLKLLPNADLILFCTSADRPFPASERALLESIAMYRKNTIILVTKMDTLDQSGGDHGEREKLKVLEWCRQHATEYLGANPMLLGISARDALHCKLTGGGHKGDRKLWKRSNFAALEDFLISALTTDTKIQAKLSSPLGLVDGWMTHCQDILEEQRRQLQTDIATMNLLQNQMDSWRKEFGVRMNEVKRDMTEPLTKQSERAHVLLRRIGVLAMYQYTLDRKGLEQEWERTSTLTSQSLSDHLHDIGRQSADSIATFARAQGQTIIEYLGRQPASRNQSLVGSVTAASRFEETRQSVATQLQFCVQRNIPDDMRSDEASFLSTIQKVYQLSLALNATAIVGALSDYLVDTTILPVAAGASVTSVALTTWGRVRVADDYRSKWQHLCRDLENDLDDVARKETERLDRRIRNAVGPYTQLIETEAEHIASQLDECENLVSSSHSLRRRIKDLSS